MLHPEVSRLRASSFLHPEVRRSAGSGRLPCTPRPASLGAPSPALEMFLIQGNLVVGQTGMREAESRDRGRVRSPSVTLSFARMAGGTPSGRFLGCAACEQIRPGAQVMCCPSLRHGMWLPRDAGRVSTQMLVPTPQPVWGTRCGEAVLSHQAFCCSAPASSSWVRTSASQCVISSRVVSLQSVPPFFLLPPQAVVQFLVTSRTRRAVE